MCVYICVGAYLCAFVVVTINNYVSVFRTGITHTTTVAQGFPTSVCRVTQHICCSVCVYILVCVCVCVWVSVSISVCLLVSHPAALAYISGGASLLSRLQRWWMETGWARLSSCPHRVHRCWVHVTPASRAPPRTPRTLPCQLSKREHTSEARTHRTPYTHPHKLTHMNTHFHLLYTYTHMLSCIVSLKIRL